LRGKKQSEDEPDGKREENDQKRRRSGVVDDGAFEAMNEIGGGKKKRDVLDGVGEKHKRNGGAGKKDKREPEELIENLCLLHGVGDAGDDEAERAERDDADADQKPEGGDIAEGRNMEHEPRQEQFDQDRGQSQGVVREDAGEEHVQLSHRADVKAAKDSLFAKHDEGGAETPEAAHNVEAKNGAKE